MEAICKISKVSRVIPFEGMQDKKSLMLEKREKFLHKHAPNPITGWPDTDSSCYHYTSGENRKNGYLDYVKRMDRKEDGKFC